MKTKLVLVTPQQAAAWLEANHNNRPLNKPYVEELARYLVQGTFQTTHQGIAFDQQNRLRDGQHRLTAIVQTGIAAQLLVATGLSEAELQAIDDGRKRTTQQVLVMLGNPATSYSATAIAREMLVGGHHLRGSKPRLKPGRQELVQFYLRHQEAVLFADQHFRNPQSGLALGYVGAVIARAFYAADKSQLEHFAKVLDSGFTKDGDESIIRLRNYILHARREQKRGFKLRDDIYSKTQRTLKDWLEGTPAKNLLGTKEELFPLPEEQLGKP
ncbi:MAG: hypothetical protein K1Y36_18640 [Blastocatellia bacterium]|nr:hypothetical protein [Blastocatellia bacterium]